MQKKIEIIDGKEIHIIDDIFSVAEIEAFYEYVNSLSFRKREKSLSYDEFPIFSTDFIPATFETETFIGKKSREILNQINSAGKDYEMCRSYINLCAYGDVEYPHFDCDPDQSDITVLYYVNKFWDYKYGGETIFYENKQSRLAILPTPGRIVIFPGNIEHMGTIPTRICKLSRYSLAMKFRKKKNHDKN
ncbi:2OG-Fe(II) oxygenase [Pedobacter cryoconitis]|uniref:2OG-Fe(II) oxygenase n=1 Tax=Pedobacter cryoconitis TaxID=188932 RepID=A0A127VGU4_9SPHI|nr:2OG-Fe(II) oxygenase [Pedobacter cryoconitis]AMQ00391.1 2OG-Fe(II) oxygenase [Pedobacter cryoconitis]